MCYRLCDRVATSLLVALQSLFMCTPVAVVVDFL